ncbi:MAG: PorT family protein [Bacteroidales bacterium]|nr:PorT family protein [Bacteroidales bacterium]
MKVKILFLIILITAVGYSSAQSFKGGVLGGITATEISGDRLAGPNKAGIYAGAFVKLDLSDKSTLQMEINYVQKGSRDNPDTSNPDSYLLRISYIEIPFQYIYHFHPLMAAEAGLSYGVLIHKYEEANGYEIDVVNPAFKKGDLSINIGFYYSITDHLRFNLRYSNSLLYVRPHGSGATYRLNKGQFNSVLSFLLFYQLNI